MSNKFFAVYAIALALTGCANDPAPTEQVLLTEKAVAQARAVGADAQLPEMKMAEDKLALTQKNMGEHDYKRARILAEQAELDARLAEAKVLTNKSQTQLLELTARINSLRKQLGDSQ